ncbi:MAG: hypothetical protein ACK4TI_01285 [Nitrososphaerales archaeon]
MRVMEGYREKVLRTFKELRAALEQLDSDAGIRISGSFAEFDGGGFIFISKAEEGFIVNICDSVKDGSGVFIPGEREKWLNLKNVAEVMNFILKTAKRPLKAYLY